MVLLILRLRSLNTTDEHPQLESFRNKNHVVASAILSFKIILDNTLYPLY